MSVPGYTIDREILHNSTATLYRAREQGSGRTVCLEVFQSSADHAVSLLHHERRGEILEAARLLDHPNIWPVLRMGEAHQGYYLVRPWWDGQFLSERLLDGERPTPALAADWVRQLGLAVQHAHDHGVTHCDLKPSNVLMQGERGSEQRPLLYGFETACLAFLPPALREPCEGLLTGTAGYMAPELLMGKRPNVTPAVDVWGLGVMLYQMLAGRMPFPGPALMDVVMAVMEREPASPRDGDPGIDADLARITMTCLRKKLEERCASAGDLAESLARWLGGERSPPPRRSFTQRLRGWIAGR
jgi:eukaryotic-like serine/threonine-protein kinase